MSAWRDGGRSDGTLLVHSTGTTATLRSLWKDLSSSGWIEGFGITDAGGATVNVAVGEFIIRSGSTATSSIYYENTVAGLTGVAIPTDTTRYLIGSWNSGAPNIAFNPTDTSNGYDLIYLGEVHNRGGVLKIHPDARPIGDFVNRAQGWAQRTIGDRVSAGLVTYDPSAPSRKIAITAGTIEVSRSMDQEHISLFDSNAGGTFTAIYGTGTYTYVAAQTQWDNTQYDNAGVLTATTVGWYSNHYVIQGYLGDVVVQYGRAQYATEAEALAEATPTNRPEEYMEHGMVIAKITFLNGATSPSTISDLRPVIGSSAPTALAPTSHPNLTDLAWSGSGHTGTALKVAGFDAGGMAAELTLGTDLTTPTGAEALTNKTLTSATNILTAPFPSVRMDTISIPNLVSYLSRIHSKNINIGFGVGSYLNGATVVANGYIGGVYSPTQNRIYLVPLAQSNQTSWHYIDCTTGTVVAYTHGATVITSGYAGGVYSPTQNRIYLVPYFQSNQTSWHYIDCATGTVVAYTHGATVVATGYAGGVYSPTQNRIYLVPYSQSNQTSWHYIDCATGTVVAYTHGATVIASGYYGGVYSPTQNRIYLVPYSQSNQTSWHYIQEYSQAEVPPSLMASALFNKL